MAKKFKQVSADFTKLDKIGDSVEGRVLAIDLDMPIKDKTRPGVVLQADGKADGTPGPILKVPLSPSCRADLAGITVGEYLRVTLSKLEPSGKGNPVKIFKLEVALES